MATRAIKPPRSLKRSFITPEGVDLQLELGSAGSRAGAFMIDFIIMTVILVVVTIGAFYLGSTVGFDKSGNAVLQFLAVLWLIGFFILRNGWFSLFEIGSRGATPGKRLMGLRVVARDGARLTGAGWGGCAIVVGEEGALRDAAPVLAREYEARFALVPRLWLSSASSGARVEAK